MKTLAEIHHNFESGRYQDVLKNWEQIDNLSSYDKDDAVNIFQMFAISAEYEGEHTLAYSLSRDALDLLALEADSHEKTGLTQMFGKIGVNALEKMNKLIRLYHFIERYNLQGVDELFARKFRNIENRVLNQVFTYIGIGYLVLVLSFSILNRMTLGLSPLTSLLMDAAIVIASVPLYFFRRNISKKMIRIMNLRFDRVISG